LHHTSSFSTPRATCKCARPTTSGRKPAHTPVMSASVTRLVNARLRALRM
jgi:hypothetical protein